MVISVGIVYKVYIVNMLFFLISVPSALAEPQLQYQHRGNRYEGIKPKPVSGYDIELISALVDYKEEVRQMPDQFRLRFYLNQPSEVHITVRELDYKYYYWMDKVHPQRWYAGFENIFTWSTHDVIKQLGEIKMYDLGIVARLKKPLPSKMERVAPVIFYHSQSPANVTGYLFTFKTNGDARLVCSIYKEKDKEPLFIQTFRRLQGGRPFTFRWDSSQAPEGFYKLVVSGYFLGTNDAIDQLVYFYHSPAVR